MKKSRYFLKIEVTHNKHKVVLSQWKYALNLQQEAGPLDFKPVHTSMDVDIDYRMKTPYLRMFLSTW